MGELRSGRVRLLTLGVGVLMLAGVAGCASTKESSDQSKGPSDSLATSDSTGVSGGDQSAPTSSTVSNPTGGSLPSGTAGAGGGAGTHGGGPAGPATPSGGGQPATKAMGPGITDKTITVGMGWFDVNAYAKALAPSAQQVNGTTKDAADAVVKYLNAHGGIAGRQIVPVYHEYPFQSVIGSPSSRSTEEQAMCSDFTEDHHAFAAIPWIASQQTFYQCAAKHNLVTISTSFSEGLVDQALYGEVSHIWYNPHSLVLDRRERMFVNQLKRRGFFPSGAKVGVVVTDLPQTRRAADNALIPALKAIGVTPAKVVYDGPEPGMNWNNAVLQFRTAGVDRVIWGASACTFLCDGQFMTASESQGYRPQNAIGSDGGLSGLSLVAPEEQLKRVVAVGWSPVDIGADEYDVAQPVNSNDALCRQIKKQSGRDLAQDLFVPYCDGLFFLKHTLEATPNLTADGFRQAVEGSGFTYGPVDAWSGAWGPGRHDGAAAVRDLAYAADCKCYKPSGPVVPIG